MPFYFASFQIAELAMQIEQAGAQFYQDLADRTQDEELKKLFTLLKNQENDHEKIFEGIKNDEKGKTGMDEYQIDLFTQMKIAIEELKNETFNLEKIPGSIDNLSKAFELAINAEKQSIAVYSMMQEKFIEKFQPALQSIIDQEKEHILFLINAQKNNPV